MSVIQQGLLITLIGMGLVFAVIIFLWGLMALMMRLTSRTKPDAAEEAVMVETDQPVLPAMRGAEGQRRAAAAAVAVALALEKTKIRSTLLKREEHDGALSPWQAYHRIRQIENKKTRG